MPYYRSVGEVPRKRHTVADSPEGRRLEELIGQEGFSEESCLLYHRHSPSALTAIEPVDDPRAGMTLTPDNPLTPRHLRTGDLPVGGEPVLGRQVVLGNDDVLLCWVAADRSSGLYRNAVGDELVYVHDGSVELKTVFGVLPLGPGDYAVIPRGVTHQWVTDDVRALVFEAAGHVRFPDRYLSTRGQLKEGAPFSERDLRGPEEPLMEEGSDVPVLVRNRAGLSNLVHQHHPFDVVGWDGCLWPHALSIHDFEPLVGAIHQPPPIHQTFAGPRFVVCSFVPRPFDFHPDAVKVPYHHANTDSDEVLFYADGDFMSREGSGIGVGSISYHPAGFTHGPQPGSWERSLDQTHTQELAVMLDTFQPLGVADVPDDPAYQRSWST